MCLKALCVHFSQKFAQNKIIMTSESFRIFFLVFLFINSSQVTSTGNSLQLDFISYDQAGWQVGGNKYDLLNEINL